MWLHGFGVLAEGAYLYIDVPFVVLVSRFIARNFFIVLCCIWGWWVIRNLATCYIGLKLRKVSGTDAKGSK